METPRSRGAEWMWASGAGAVVRHESFCGLGLPCIHESGKPLPQKAFVEDVSVVGVVGTEESPCCREDGLSALLHHDQLQTRRVHKCDPGVQHAGAADTLKWLSALITRLPSCDTLWSEPGHGAKRGKDKQKCGALSLTSEHTTSPASHGSVRSFSPWSVWFYACGVAQLCTMLVPIVL